MLSSKYLRSILSRVFVRDVLHISRLVVECPGEMWDLRPVEEVEIPGLVNIQKNYEKSSFLICKSTISMVYLLKMVILITYPLVNIQKTMGKPPFFMGILMISAKKKKTSKNESSA